MKTIQFYSILAILWSAIILFLVPYKQLGATGVWVIATVTVAYAAALWHYRWRINRYAWNVRRIIHAAAATIALLDTAIILYLLSK